MSNDEIVGDNQQVVTRPQFPRQRQGSRSRVQIDTAVTGNMAGRHGTNRLFFQAIHTGFIQMCGLAGQTLCRTDTARDHQYGSLFLQFLQIAANGHMGDRQALCQFSNTDHATLLYQR